jgi:alpha-amylase
MKNVNLVLCLHMHQPLGNFPDVVDRIVKETYRPVLDALQKHPGVSVNLHFSGVLLEMLAERHPEMVQQLRDLVATGRVEMMTGGFYEPVLVEWAEEDRDGQLAMMAGWLKNRLGAEPVGAWLAEGVWGPSLCSSFNRAGIQYAAIDGSFFLQAGISPAKLNGHYVTDQAGDLLTVFPTCPDLARLIPHAPWDDLFGHLRRIANRGEDITLTLAANLEAWPTLPGGAAGYLDTLFTKLEESANWIHTLTGRAQIKRQAPKGRVALPPGTPAELGGWSLPGAARREFFRERAQLGQRYDAAKVLPFFRGGSWASFRVRYSEVNLVYRKNLMLSRRLRAKAKAPKSRPIQEKIWRAQCSTAQWHGSRGGLHLPHLREAIWKELLVAEAELRDGQAEAELLREDFDADGQLEIYAAHPKLTMMVAPHQGGCCLELGFPALGRNLANTLTRRDEGTNSAPPPVTDWYDRNLFQEHFFARGTTVEQLSAGTYPELGDFILQPFQLRQMRQTGNRVTVEMFRDGGLYRMGLRQPCQLDKIYAIDTAGGLVEISYQLTNTGTLPLEAVFATELNLNLGPDQGGRGTVKAGDLQKTDRESWQTTGVKGLSARSVDGMELRIMTDNLPLAWGYPILDVEAGPEGPIRQGNSFLLGQHLDLKPKEKAEFRIKLSFVQA